MKHEKVLSGSFMALTMLFLSFDLSVALGTTYCRPDLGNHNTKYEIMISLQGLQRHYLYSLVTLNPLLGASLAHLKGHIVHSFGVFVMNLL